MRDNLIELEVLAYPEEPTRIVRVRVERPAETNGALLPAVLVLHGFKGFMHWGFFPELSRRLAEAGLIVVSLNVSGCGVGEDLETHSDEEGFAKNTYSKEVEDLELVRAFAADLSAVDGSRMAVLGHSRGGGVALLHAARRGGYRAVVTWSAIDDIHQLDESTKALWREQGFILIPNGRTGQDHRLDLDALHDADEHGEALDILSACRDIAAPALVVHGRADQVVEFAASERLVAALPRARHLPIEDGDHTFGATHPFTSPTPQLERALESTRAFLLEHLT